MGEDEDPSFETPLRKAARENNIQEAKALIMNGAEIDAGSMINHTALHFAAENGHKEMVELLIENGANVNAKSYDTDTPLHFAAENGNKAVVSMLIKEGADVNAKGLCGYLPLHYANRFDKPEIVDILLQNGSKINEKDVFGRTPLHIAAVSNSKMSVKVLLEAGANIDAQCSKSETPLQKAAKNGNFDTVKSLSKRGAKLDGALHFAASKPIVDFLLEHGLDIEEKRGSKQWTPLHSATDRGFHEAVEALISKGANIEAEDDESLTPLHLGLDFNQQGRDTLTLEILLRNGANVNAGSHVGFTPLHNAAFFGLKKEILLLIQHGAEINADNNIYGITPLMYVIARNSYECVPIVGMLMELGASLKTRNEYGKTPLECALKVDENIYQSKYLLDCFKVLTYTDHKLEFLKAISYH